MGRYSRDVDYLTATINYLGTNPHWVGRSASQLANELSLDPQRVARVFQAFPAIFRKSKQTSEANEHYYSLQARYALRLDEADSNMTVGDIAPLTTEQVRSLIDFVTHSAREEATSVRHWVTNGISMVAAVVAAIAAIVSANVEAPVSTPPATSAESASAGK